MKDNRGPLKEETPNQFINLAEEIEKGFDEIGKLPTRLERYAFARERALINLAQIDVKINQTSTSIFHDHLVKLRSRVAICGDYLGFKNYYTVGKVRLTAANFCMVPLLCPLCAIRRGSKLLDAYVKRLQVIQSKTSGLRVSMLTLTVKNGQDLGERFGHLKHSVSNMLERRRRTIEGKAGYHSQFAKIAGLVGTYEVTKDGALDGTESGWHPHAHMMVLHAERFDYTELQAEWLKITGDSHVLNVAPAQHPEDPAQDFLEVFKYALKFTDLTPEQNLDAYEVLRGKRLVFSAGLFWGVEIPESMLDEELDSLPFFEMIYKYIAGSGYNLTTRSEL